jgi:acetate kinase
VLLYLLQSRGMTATDVSALLYRQSGLLGVSNLSADVRTLLASPAPEAAEALDLFAYHAAKHVGALCSALGGLDGLVFTAGIGEHVAAVRAAICARLGWLGLELSRQANEANESAISAVTSRVEVRVMATDEETMIARHCRTLLRGEPA